MSDEVAILRVACAALQQEFKRIEELLNPSKQDELLREYARRINKKFQPSTGKAKKLLRTIETSLTNIDEPEADPAADEQSRAQRKQEVLDEGWAAYVELKTEVMPALSSELLAVIGGIYLSEKQLDDIREISESERKEKNIQDLSFSKIAQNLVDAVAYRSAKDWESVLIVGEEPVGHSAADIIRLRFPACDIWNLPFTAHEYGYLVAYNRAPKKFNDLRAQIERIVNPKHQIKGSPPENQECFLDGVISLWENSRKLTPEELDEFVRQREREIDLLTKQQIAYLCRLFADAFATAFIGPAYVHALLHLRFIPDHTLYKSSAAMPPFAHRFVFALETLKWMNNETGFRGETPVPFERELYDSPGDSQGGFPLLWRQTLASAKQADEYQAIFAKYEPWFRKVKMALSEEFDDAIEDTFKYWKTARELEKQIDGQLNLTSRPDMVAILNAAWSARWQHPESLNNIESNALRLLDESDKEVITAPEQLSKAAGIASKVAVKSDTAVSEAVRRVKQALAKQPGLRSRFVRMEQENFFTEDSMILDALGGNDEAYEAYLNLCNPAPGRDQFDTGKRPGGLGGHKGSNGY